MLIVEEILYTIYNSTFRYRRRP